MFEMVFLGTSASAPSLTRNLASTMVLCGQHRFLIDCGEGTQRQLLRSGLGFRRLNRILLTHGHLDHILGLGGLISTFSRWEAIDQLRIYGGEWALERVKDLVFSVVFRGTRPEMEIELIEVSPGVILEEDKFTLRAFPVAHRGPGCYGYTFQERSRRPFLADKAEELGVPPGPERKELVRGKPITLADERVVRPEEVLGEAVPGAKLVYVGDASRVDDLVYEAWGADALVVEATYLKEEAHLAKRYSHLTATQAATLAKEAQVRVLYINHVSRRYSEEEVLAEACSIFPHTVVAKDLERVEVVKVK